MADTADFIFWNNQKETRIILNEIDEELIKINKDILNGYMISSKELIREYCRKIGYREGLLFLQRQIEEKTNNEPTI